MPKERSNLYAAKGFVRRVAMMTRAMGGLIMGDEARETARRVAIAGRSVIGSEDWVCN